MPVFAQSRLAAPDYAVLIGYFLLMLGIGVYFHRFMSGLKMYFAGGNRIPWWLSGVSFYMTSFSAFAFVSYSDLAYKYGLFGVTMMWVAVPATLFSAGIFAARWRRARIDSPMEYLEHRYSPALRQIFVWQGVPFTLMDDCLKLVATGKIVQMATGLSPVHSILASGLIMLSYTFMGGLWAVTVTDFVQFVVLAAAVIITLPLALARVGGIGALVERAPEGFFNVTSPERGWGSLFVVVLLYCVAYSANRWSLIQKYYCVPTERDARRVGWMFALLGLVSFPLMFLPAMAARQFLPVGPGESVYAAICGELLPVGVLGLMVAAMFSATMSTLSGDFNVCASVLTHDVYRLLRPGASDRELVNVGRGLTLAVGLLGVGLALVIANASGEDLFRYMLTLFGIAGPPVGIPMMAGLVWRRANNAGAIAALAVGLGSGLLAFGAIGSGRLDLPYPIDNVLFVVTATATLATLVLVSWLRPMGAAEQARVDAFLQKLATPIGALPQDRASPAAGGAIAPFRVVGVCTMAIGGLLLAVQPWIGFETAGWWNVALAAAMLLLGGAMWAAARSRTAID